MMINIWTNKKYKDFSFFEMHWVYNSICLNCISIFNWVWSVYQSLVGCVLNKLFLIITIIRDIFLRYDYSDDQSVFRIVFVFSYKINFYIPAIHILSDCYLRWSSFGKEYFLNISLLIVCHTTH